MGYGELETLAASYPAQERDAFSELALEYRRRNEREILELAALAADVSFDDVINIGLEPDLDPQFHEAFQRQYPNVSLDSLIGRSEKALEGFAKLKGKYFEVLVRDRLKAGERLGELQLLPGQAAELAESPTQEGWDLLIRNADGSIAEELQLKASENMAYIKQALDRYPDIRIATPLEVDASAEEIVGTDIPNSQLEHVTQTQIEELSESAAEDHLESGAEAVVDVFPLMSVLTTGVIEGRNVLAGRATLQGALRSGAKRVGKNAVYAALGSATGIDLAVVPLRIAESRTTARIDLGDRLEPRTEELRRLTA